MDWVKKNLAKNLKQVKLPDAVKNFLKPEDTEQTPDEILIASAKSGVPEDVLEALIDGQVDATDNDGRSGLWWAAYHGHVHCVDILIKEEANVNLGDKWGFTPLISCCMKGRDDCARLLCQTAKLDQRNESGCTAAWWAASNGHSKCLHILAKRGANLELRDEEGHTPAFQASKNDHIECLRILALGNALERDRKRAPKRRKKSYPPLNRLPGKVQEASQESQEKHVRFCEPKENSEIPARREALQSTPPKRKLSMPNMKMRSPEKREKSDKSSKRKSRPPRKRANSHPPAKEEVKSEKKRVVKKNHPYSQAQLDMQIVKYAKKGDMDKLKQCIERGANLDARDKALRTAVSCAAFQGHVEILNFLIKEGAHPNLPDKLGNTPLIRAIRGDHPDIVRILSPKVDLDQSGNMGQTATYCAAANGRANILQVLIESGARIDVVDNQGNTPAHAAAKYGRQQCILVLTQNGADFNVKNNQDKTPLDMAKSDEMKALLENSMGLIE